MSADFQLFSHINHKLTAQAVMTASPITNVPESMTRHHLKCPAKYAWTANSMMGTQWASHCDISCKKLSLCLCGSWQPSAQVLLWCFKEHNARFLLCFHIFSYSPSVHELLPLFESENAVVHSNNNSSTSLCIVLVWHITICHASVCKDYRFNL